MRKITSLLRKIFEKKGFLVTIAFVLIGCNLILNIASLKTNRIKIVYVSMPKLYSGFRMKTDLEMKLKNIETGRERELEQMQSRIRPVILSPNDSFLTPAEYKSKAGKVIENSKQIANKFTDQIWSRLNQYIKDYCREKNISIVLGADGAGTVMAADPNLDETESILAYVNKRYQGINTSIENENE